MDAPDAAWFARHTDADGTWTGPGLVVNADYSQFYLYGEDLDITWEPDDSIANVTPEGNVVFSTNRQYGPAAVQIAVTASAPTNTNGDGWDGSSSFVLPVIDASHQLISWAGYGPGHDIELPLNDHHALVRRVSHDSDDENLVDQVREFFLVQLWPTGGTTESDQLRRRRGDRDSAATAEEARRSEDAAKRAEATRRAELWGELDPPSDLEALGAEAARVAKGSYELALGVARSDPHTARGLAAWAVQTVATQIDGPPSVDLTPAVDAIRSGTPLPPPFDDIGMAFKAMLPPTKSEGFGSFGFAEPPAQPRGATSAPAATCAAICSTDVADPIEAAMRALNQASAGFVDKPAFWRRAEEQFSRLQ